MNHMHDLHSRIRDAVDSLRLQINWRPGSAVRHLLKRKVRGHLPGNATLQDYERIIRTVLEDSEAEVYAYWFQDTPYATVVAVVEERHWLVMFDLAGWMESAFVVEQPEQHLNRPAFQPLGLLGDLLNDKL